jgi:glycosyltransferase involved in cell wall biosynthesis
LLLLYIFLSSSLMMFSSRWLPNEVYGPPVELNVCLITADFWGASAPGGTATAFELLVRNLQKAGIPATLVGASKDCEPRSKFEIAHKDLKSSVFLCEDYLDTPLEKETYPYETAGLLALKFLQTSQCNVVHFHEWGGIASAPLAASEAGFLPGQRHIVQLHGGNLWSTQHGQRPLHDMTALRIDANEKLSIELAHELTSPSQYMADWYGARGWKLPSKVPVVPNCVSLPALSLPGKNSSDGSSPSTDASQAGNLIKPVKSVAFFGRLETRKGIEIFFNAISMLPSEVLSNPEFRVLVVGGSAQIQSQKSELWIENRIKSLPTALNASQVVLKVGLSREMALKEILGAETLVAFGSMIENAPFALVEASKLGLPYVALDTGGVQEVVDLEGSAADVQFNPLNLTETTTALAAALEVRLRAGKAAVPKLRPVYEQGDKLWVEWHSKVAQEMNNVIPKQQRPLLKASTTERSSSRKLLNEKTSLAKLTDQILYVTDGPNALIKLHKDACEASGDPSQVLLLVPGDVIEINGDVWSQQLLPILDKTLDSKLHAVTLGATVANSSTVAFAGSPTWTYYGSNSRCTPAAPLAIRRKTLCSQRLLSRNFQRADAWTLALLLKKAGLGVAPLPFSEAAVLKEWQVAKCLPENPPDFWSFDTDVTVNLRYDPQLALFKDLATLGKVPEPLASFFSDEKHWKLFPESARDQNCEAAQLVPPYFCDNILHPSSTSTAIASFQSWFALNVDIFGEVRACPLCAEGPVIAEVVVVRKDNLKINDEEKNEVMWTHQFEAGSGCAAKVVSLSGIQIHVDDEVRIVARGSPAGHSCAGIYLPTFDIYPASGDGTSS